MKQKLTTLLFGLLLAVGWTSSAFAQEATYTASGIKSWTYDWVDENGVTQTSYYIDQETGQADQVTNPYQMYGMLRSIYMDKRFPGPTYAGYANNGTTRQREVYYGDIAGGWSISNTELSDIYITTNATNVNIASVTLYDENDQPIEGQTWTCPSSGGQNLQMPSGWTLSKTPTHTSGNAYIYFNNGGSIIIPASAFAGKTAVRVDVRCRRTAGQQNTTTNRIAVGPSGDQETQWFSVANTWYDKTWNVVGQTSTTQYKPEAEGYTAIVVAVKDTTNLPAELPSPLAPNSATSTILLLNSKADIIDYFTKNVVYMKLLTDGLRIGSDSDYSRGTVFSCDGRYNKFFFLSKGQARQKDTDYVIDYQATNGLLGELGPFKEMFEEFSPTSGEQNSQITDFYSKMMEGSVYNILHDCASVIQMGHQFSMSGNAGVEHFPLSGLNFFIPDYRLKYWADGSNDGRDMNPSSTSGWRTHYAQYNQDYAPKVGIYKITLRAEAEMIAAADTTHQPGNRNYKVTLNWVSSLNEMSGHTVPQTYTVYYYDENGQRQKLVVEGQTNADAETGNTTLTYYVEQRQHSYTIDYIVMGTPDDNEHPAFIAWSNVDGVVIPGWDDFLALSKDHHESDFIVSDMANWYRNFMLVDNDIFNGLTVENVSNGMNTFNIYRYNNKDASEKKIAILSFDNPTAERVHYTVTYDDAGTNSDLEDQMILETPKYQRSTMGIPDEGYVRVVGNGDIVIQPSSYDVNFKSITVKNNGSTIASWNYNQSNLPNGWGVSPGSVWEPYTVTSTGDKVYYLEGGGYIYIPNILNNSNNTNVTVEIVAYGDGAAHANIAVNDHKQAIANNTAATYTWNVSGTRGGDRATTYEKVTSADQLVTGKKYIFVYENGSNSYAMGSYSNGSDASAVAVALNGNTVDVNDNIMQFTLGSADGYYTFTKPSDGGLLGLTYTGSYWSGYNYYFTTGGSYYRWNVTSNSNGYITNNASATSVYIKYFSSDNSFILGESTNNPNAVLYVEKDSSTPTDPTVEGGLLRLGHLHIVDQLKEAIPEDNSHPDNYTYVLRYQPTDPNEAKSSGTVTFNIEKTAAKVNGFYTKEEVDADTFEPLLTLDMLKADVSMDLRESNPNVLYQQIQGKENAIPELGKDYLTQLGKMGTSDRYMEMLETSPNFEQVYDADIHHYFDHSVPLLQGTYNQDYFTYAPSVSTWGLDRRYYETDGLDNTYGAPYFKTGVGKVEVSQALAQKQMKQVTVDGQQQWIPNPSTSWTEGDVEGAQAYTLYFLSTTAQGFLPSAAVSNIPYEPYMFRVFVESASGKLRKFEPVYGTNSQGQEIQIGLKDGGPITGKYCLGSYDINSGTWTWDGESQSIMFSKGISNDAPTATNPGWNGNMKYGAATDITDLKVYVRFYYMRQGWNSRDDGPARPANGSESRGQDPGSDTGIFDIFGTAAGEVVSTTYYNAQGIQSDKPFDGLNIVVTRYSNGTTSTTKVIR